MPVTKFDFPEKYEYLVGFGVYHQYVYPLNRRPDDETRY